MLTGFVKQHIVSDNNQSTRETPPFVGGFIVAHFMCLVGWNTFSPPH